jgi:hypothetical protein
MDHLEGELRPMESVTSDFLRDSVELALRKSSRVIRPVKASASRDLSVSSPELCAEFLPSLFAKIAADFSVPTTMLALDNYFRFKLSRRSLITSAKAERIPATKQSVKFQADSPDEPKTLKSKLWSGHLAAQLGAVRSDGRKYRCNRPKDCTYRHIVVGEKSSQVA